MTYTFHEDPGHGWLEVPRRELHDLGIADKITYYSYQSRDGQTVYLEEDCDLSTFADAKGYARFSDIPHITRVYNHDAPCRNYRSYQP